MTWEEHRKRKDILVISPNRMTFWVNPKTLEPYDCGTYDPYPWEEEKFGTVCWPVNYWSKQVMNKLDKNKYETTSLPRYR